VRERSIRLNKFVYGAISSKASLVMYIILFIFNLISEKMAEATRKFAALQNELRISLGDNRNNKLRQKTGGRSNVPARKIQELKLAFSEFYLSLILLQNYQNLNFTGFRKILKKHDKVSYLTSALVKPY
jgi:SPX domain protein involved in polyphosphate accumulation